MSDKNLKIFVISLKSSHNRRKLMEQRLNKLGLAFEIFDAVRGSDLSEAEVTEYYDKDYWNNRPDYFTLGAVGCTMSHFFVYEKIVKEKIKTALILEDDMVFNKNTSELLGLIATKTRNDEVVMLFYQSYSPIKVSAGSADALTEKFKLYQVCELKGLRATGGYIIKYEAAKRMAENLRPFRSLADDWKLYYERGILNGVRIAYPFLMDDTYQATTISPNTKGGSLVKNVISFFEKHKIPPVYHLLRRRRKIHINNARKVEIVDGPATDFRKTDKQL